MERAVTLPAERGADTAQAEVFHALLAERRKALSNRLDKQAVELARYKPSRDWGAAAPRKRRQIKEIGAEIRDIDRMMRALGSRLLDVQRKQRSG